MREEVHQPDRDRPPEALIEIDFFGSKLSISRKEYERSLQIEGLRHDSVMLHEILEACAELEMVFLQDDFREVLRSAILYSAGDHQGIRDIFVDQAIELSQAEFERLVRLGVVEMSSFEAIAHLPNVALSINGILEAVEDMAAVRIRMENGSDALREFLGDSVRLNARLAAVRFFNTFLESTDCSD